MADDSLYPPNKSNQGKPFFSYVEAGLIDESLICPFCTYPLLSPVVSICILSNPGSEFSNVGQLNKCNELSSNLSEMDWGNTSDDEGGCDGCTVVLLHCCTVVLLYCKICFVSVELYLLYLFALYYKIYINNIIIQLRIIVHNKQLYYTVLHCTHCTALRCSTVLFPNYCTN